MTYSYVPTPDDKFAFGLWMVDQTERTPSGEPTRAVLSAPYITQKLGELGAQTYLFWSRDSRNFLADYSQAKAYGYRFALEPKPNEPRGDIFFPTASSTLGFIATLERPDQLTVDLPLGMR